MVIVFNVVTKSYCMLFNREFWGYFALSTFDWQSLPFKQTWVHTRCSIAGDGLKPIGFQAFLDEPSLRDLESINLTTTKKHDNADRITSGTHEINTTKKLKLGPLCCPSELGLGYFVSPFSRFCISSEAPNRGKGTMGRFQNTLGHFCSRQVTHFNPCTLCSLCSTLITWWVFLIQEVRSLGMSLVLRFYLAVAFASISRYCVINRNSHDETLNQSSYPLGWTGK